MGEIRSKRCEGVGITWMMIVRVEVKVMIATPESACSTMKYSVTSISDQVSAS